MEAVTSVLDSINGFVKSGEQFVKAKVHSLPLPHLHDPIQILKRLQRESFSDLMKLRDRQDKAERIITTLQSGNGSLNGTNMRGTVNARSTLFLNDDLQAYNNLLSSEKKSDIAASFTFRTRIRQTDALVAEVVARHGDGTSDNGSSESPLTLSKVMYATNLSDVCSIISVPYGATCSDFELDSYNTQDACVSGFPLCRPPSFSKRHGFAAGLKIRTSNFAASLAELICAPGKQLDSTSSNKILNTFGQISYRLFTDAKLSISGAWQIPCSLSTPIRFGKFRNRGAHSKSHEKEASSENASQAIEGTSGSLCMVLDIDESTKLGGWVEVQNLNSSSVKWAASLSDMPEYDIGWGVSLGGSVEGQLNPVLLEGFLNFNVDKRGSLQPGLVFALNGRHRAPAVVLRTNWSL